MSYRQSPASSARVQSHSKASGPSQSKAAKASPNLVQISNLQVFMIVLAGIVAFGHFVYIHLAIQYAGRDAWLSLLLGGAIGCGIMFLHLTGAISPGKSLVRHAQAVFGKWLGGALSMVYVLFFIVIVAITMHITTDFMRIVYPTTPPVLFLIGEFSIAIWISYAGVEGMARIVQILLPILMLIGLMASLLSIPDKDFTEIFPIMNRSWDSVWLGALVFVVMFSEMIAFNMISENAREPKKLTKQSLVFGLVVLVMFLSPVVGPIMVFGETLAQNLAFPTFTEIQYIHIGQVIERLDILGILLWTIGSFLRISMYMYAAVKAVSQIANVERESTFLFPVAMLSIGFSLAIQNGSREEIFHFLRTDYLILAPAIGVGLPLLTAVVGLLRSWMGGKKGHSNKGIKQKAS